MRYVKASGLTIPNAIFMLAFFGSFAVVARLGYRWELPWLLLIIGWAIAIRWWMVAGLFLGLLVHPIQLHVIDIEGRLWFAGAGALVGLAVELVWDELRPLPKRPTDTAQQAPGPHVRG